MAEGVTGMHRRYAWYVIRHKWFVFVECCKLGIPLAGIVHDLSKLHPAEWLPYARNFYDGKDGKGSRGGYVSIYETHGDFRNVMLDSGRYQEAIREDFDRAWLRHQHKNPHHWQHWVLREDSGATKLLEMPLRYRKEMLADWRGAGRAVGKPDTPGWYARNREQIMLAPETRAWIEAHL